MSFEGGPPRRRSPHRRPWPPRPSPAPLYYTKYVIL